MDDSAWLTVAGDTLVDAKGRPVRLAGVGLGGWLNMENFITGYPFTESAMRDALRRTLGEEGYARFFDRFLTAFFDEADARFLASIGLNSVRVPFHYRIFEDDARPFRLKEEGFALLDRVIDICAAAGVYVILDLHAAPGWQNHHWHSDNPTGRALFWRHPHFQDRVVHLWGYDSVDDRAKKRAALAADPEWQEFLKVQMPLIQTMENKILSPAPFMEKK